MRSSSPRDLRNSSINDAPILDINLSRPLILRCCILAYRTNGIFNVGCDLPPRVTQFVHLHNPVHGFLC